MTSRWIALFAASLCCAPLACGGSSSGNAPGGDGGALEAGDGATTDDGPGSDGTTSDGTVPDAADDVSASDAATDTGAPSGPDAEASEASADANDAAGPDAADAAGDASDGGSEADAGGDASDGATSLCSCVVCTPLDACHVAGVCNPSTGVCSTPPADNGTACDDGNACTQTDTCQVGVCRGINPVTCTALDACHVAGLCNRTTGVCSNPPAADGTACTDGNACTQTDTCQAGTCTGGSRVTCTALDACHLAGTCNPGTGVCSNPVAADGTACTDGNACTQVDACLAGTCTGTKPVLCIAQDLCHVAGTCDPGSGVCSNPVAADGTACTDGNGCTRTDSCQAGVCSGSNPVTCTAQDPCHVAGTCDPGTGTCSNPAAPDGTSCTSSVACTLSASCQAGTCSGSACGSGLCGTSLSAFTGTQTSGWAFNGNAAYDGAANTAVLVDGLGNGEAGTLFYQDPITVDAFTFAFDFKITTVSGRADGIAFVMQTNGPSALGAAYGGFGALGLTGYGVELDVFDSGPCDLGNGNHASVDLLSACSTNGGVPAPIAASNDLFDTSLPGDGVGDIGDGVWRTTTIQMASGQVSVSISGPTGTAVSVGNLQGVALPGFVAGTPYYLGLTAGTGSNGLAARQEVRNVQVSFGATHCL